MSLQRLTDDGLHQDGQTNDGIYGNSYSPSVGGYHGLLVTAEGTYQTEDYLRTASALFSVAPDSASLNGSYSDRGVDANSDNIYEYLEITIGVDVTQVSTYTVSAELYSGETFISHARAVAALNAGSQTVKIDFAGEDIFNSQLDGPYTVRNVLLLDESGATILIEAQDNTHSTSSYSYTEFGERTIYLPMVSRP